MSRCVSSKDKGKNKRIITQIGSKEYLIEGECDWARFGYQFDPSVITSVDVDGGPFLLVGDSFLGKGHIKNIQHIDNNQDGYIILKIILA